MIGQLFAQSGDLFGRDGAAVIPPLTSLVSQHVGNSLISQCFVPWLHNRAAEFLAFDGDRALQTLEDNHGRPSRPTGCKLRTSKRRILTRDTKTVGLMTGLTVRREDLFSAVTRRKLCLLFATARSSGSFLCRWRSAERVEAITGKISGVTPQISAAKENGEAINRDQPNRKRLKSDARFAFLALNSGMNVLNIGSFAVISSLTSERRTIASLLVHFV